MFFIKFAYRESRIANYFAQYILSKLKDEETKKQIHRLKMIRDNIEIAKKSIIKKIDSNINLQVLLTKLQKSNSKLVIKHRNKIQELRKGLV